MSKCYDNPEYDKIDDNLQNTWKQSKYVEPKQETKCYCGHTTYCDCGPLEEPKQETL